MESFFLWDFILYTLNTTFSIDSHGRRLPNRRSTHHGVRLEDLSSQETQPRPVPVTWARQAVTHSFYEWAAARLVRSGRQHGWEFLDRTIASIDPLSFVGGIREALREFLTPHRSTRSTHSSTTLSQITDMDEAHSDAELLCSFIYM